MCDSEPIAVDLEVGALAGRRDDDQYTSLGTRSNNAYILCREEQYLQHRSHAGALCDGGIERCHHEDLRAQKWPSGEPRKELLWLRFCIRTENRTDVDLQRTKEQP